MADKTKGRGTQDVGPLASVEPWILVADDYTIDLLSWAEQIARQALQLASLPPLPHIVDVACGPGTLALLAARETGGKLFDMEMVLNPQSGGQRCTLIRRPLKCTR